MTTALERLIEGNQRYRTAKTGSGDISPERRADSAQNGQHPFAMVITCSDSRVIPEAIFDCGIGELFVIRTAGNTIGPGEAGSVEYGLDHLHIQTVIVLGHTGCGAVAAALQGHGEGQVAGIIKKIQLAIGSEKDPCTASLINARNSIRCLEETFGADYPEVQFISALYDIQTGVVRFEG